MTKSKSPTAPFSKPFKVRGWLICSECSATPEFGSLGNGPAADGGWPMHRCGYEIRPFTSWTPDNPKRLEQAETTKETTPDD